VALWHPCGSKAGCSTINIKNIHTEHLKIESLRERIERLRSAMEVGVQRLKLTPCDHTARNKLEEDIARLDELERELIDRVAVVESDMRDIETSFEMLDDNEQTIMRLRYINGFNWGKVSVWSGYSVQHCFTLHKRAILKLNSK